MRIAVLAAIATLASAAASGRRSDDKNNQEAVILLDQPVAVAPVSNNNDNDYNDYNNNKDYDYKDDKDYKKCQHYKNEGHDDKYYKHNCDRYENRANEDNKDNKDNGTAPATRGQCMSKCEGKYGKGSEDCKKCHNTCDNKHGYQAGMTQCVARCDNNYDDDDEWDECWDACWERYVYNQGNAGQGNNNNGKKDGNVAPEEDEYHGKCSRRCEEDYEYGSDDCNKCKDDCSNQGGVVRGRYFFVAQRYNKKSWNRGQQQVFYVY